MKKTLLIITLLISILLLDGCSPPRICGQHAPVINITNTYINLPKGYFKNSCSCAPVTIATESGGWKNM